MRSKKLQGNGKRSMGRREFLKAGLFSGGLATTAMALKSSLVPSDSKTDESKSAQKHADHRHDGSMGTVGGVDHEANGFDPHEMLSDWDYGEVSTLPDGQTLREYQIVAVDKEIEIAPGVFFPGWVYNGRVPGPTLRCVEGDRIRVEFINAGTHPHTIHFHGIHGASMDGVPGVGAGMIEPGESTIYEFDAFPFGCHLYHCHAIPLKRHIHKGLYGAFIIDPDPEKYTGRDREIAESRNHTYPRNANVHEMVMVMNGFDTNFDGDNEVYAVNSIANAYMDKPIKIRRDQLQRLYLVNLTEFDPINSFHLHANFFDYYDHGTTFEPTLKTVDTIMQCQAQRGIIEFSFEGFEPGLYMFHAHQSEFAELGWMGFFEVTDS
ncbi:MAG: multicopper oxidase domain-containing protein [Anaerolineales bacterium]|nr:multicopper oxidase domain-containing protein [Anaerolineales bacterium]